MRWIYSKMINKRGLSTVVAALMLILLVLALVLILWTVVRNLVEGELDQAGSCIDTFDKVTLNDAFTCYNQSSGELKFAIGVEDIDVDKAIVAISTEGQTKSFEITNTDGVINNLKYLEGSYGASVKLPDKNGGLTYLYNMTSAGFSGVPKKIEIVPVVGGNQCDPSDNIVEITNCIFS